MERSSGIKDTDTYDDSTGLSVESGNLPDGRNCKTEVWSEDGYTFLTYRFPSSGLVTFTKEQVINYLLSQGIKIDLKKFPLDSMQLLTDSKDSDLYNLTITIGESDE